jgi:stress response protein YsnF
LAEDIKSPKKKIGKRTRRGVSEKMKGVGSIVSKTSESKSIMPSPNEIIVPPELQKADTHIVRPSFLIKQNSVASKVSKVVDSIKEKTDQAVEVIKGATGIGSGLASDDITLDDGPLIIPVLEQKFSTNKKTVLENVTVEKRWVEGKRFVEVPVKYEQIFVNNEEVRKSGLGEAFTQLKGALLKIVPIEYDKKEDDKSNWVPLFGPDTNMETTVPLYAEQLVISKKIVKVGDFVIRKREVTKQENLDVGPIREEVTIENPGDRIG